MSMDTNPIVFQARPDRAPPVGQSGALHWLKTHLFNGLINSTVTLLLLLVVAQLITPLFRWAVLDATWVGDNAACNENGAGACWAFVAAKARVLFVGVYPGEEVWRPGIGAIVLIVLTALTMMQRLTGKLLVACWVLLPIFGYWLIGGGAGLNYVDQSQWGGLMLSLLLAIVGIIVSMPLGILLALGRHNGAPLTKAICVGIIELVRGVPLITILFMATVMMPLLLPPDFVINNMLRIQAGMIIFSAAYIAEVVRGGLQALPKGQAEASNALGLGSFHTTALVVLPQALRHVLPPLIGRCIALFKDTSLVIIVGLLDFLGMLKSASLDSEWLGFDIEGYVFGAFIYWVVCYSLSRYGRILETRGPVSH